MYKNRLVALFLVASLTTAPSDPLITSWQTSISSKYARIYSTTTNRTNGVSATTWTNGTQSQSSPAYAGVNEIDASTSYVYILTTGLGGQIMGPWSNPNVPKNQQDLWRFPRTPTVPTTNRTSSAASPTTATSVGAIGFMVDGVAAYNTSDGFSYDNSRGEDASPIAGIGNGDGIWNRDAFVNEFSSFDNSLAHPQPSGEYHYHVNPIATRYLMGDNILYNSSTKTYSENTATTTFTHSPILAWMKDGLPLYGPYGYDGGGLGAAATAVISGGAVSSVTVTSAGTYTFAPQVTFSSGSATATAGMKVVSASIFSSQNSSAGGTGYQVGDILTVSGGTATTAATLTVTAITGSGGSGPISTLSVSNPGTYTVVPPNYVSVTGGNGSGAVPTLIWGIGAINVTNGGSGYTTAPTVNIGGVRRMVSGYQLRDGTNNTTNLNTTGRQSLPGWAQTVQGRTTLISSQYGPAVSATYGLGHYAEDYDYLGDLGYIQGSRFNTGSVYFDLDAYNSRFCITPDYPGGTWAYFTTITSTGTSFYPYSVGRWYRGNPNTGGGSTTSATKSSDGATTQFLGGANTAITIGTPSAASGTVTLTWSAVEGGSYSVANSPNDSTFTTESSDLSPGNVPTAPTVGNDAVTATSGYSTNGLTGTQYAKVSRTALATYDSAGQTASTVSQSATATYDLVSSVATLSGLTISAGSLSPTFGSATTSYTATETNVSSITVTPTATQANATITVNGTLVSSGTASGNIALSSGSNTITNLVTAQDGVTTQTYTVTVGSDASPVITSPSSVVTAAVNAAYSYTFFTASGYPAPTFTLTSGNLPPGITLSSSGLLSGSPTQAGSYSGTVTATNNSGIATQNFTITTSPALTFSAWENLFTGVANPLTDLSPTGTPENDGVSTLLKYVYNLNPTLPMSATDRAALATIGRTTIDGTQYLTLTFRQYALLSGLTVSVETSPDLTNWTTVATEPSAMIIQTGTDSTTGDPIMQAEVPSAGTNQFIRLNATAP